MLNQVDPVACPPLANEDSGPESAAHAMRCSRALGAPVTIDETDLLLQSPKPKIMYGMQVLKYCLKRFEERIPFSRHINKVLGDDAVASRHLPLDVESDELFERVRDGILLVKLVNVAQPGAIDERQLCTDARMSEAQMSTNVSLAIKAATDLGCDTASIESREILDGRYECKCVYEVVCVCVVVYISVLMSYLRRPGW